MTGTKRRLDALSEVAKCVCRDRQGTYGDAEDNFADIATIASIVFRDKLKKPLDALDVATFCACIKLARIRCSPKHRDNWIDLAGYAVCGAGILEGQK
jgi:hypothetical protein